MFLLLDKESIMTFEQWWKEYCVKHSIVVGSSFENGMKQTAEDAFKEGYICGGNAVVHSL